MIFTAQLNLFVYTSLQNDKDHQKAIICMQHKKKPKQSKPKPNKATFAFINREGKHIKNSFAHRCESWDKVIVSNSV